MTASKKTAENIDAEWREIQAAQQNPARFGVLYERYYDTIFRFIYRRTTDEMLAGDICAQVFLKAMQKLHKYKYRGVPFSAWLYRIASNEVTQHFRNLKKSRVVSIDDTMLGDFMEEVEETDTNEMVKLLPEIINSLSADDVQLLELRFFEQRAFKEVAHIMEITESNAKVKTYRLLKKMKKMMLKKTANQK